MKASAQRLASWQRSPLGRALLEAESQLMEVALDDVFGHALLQVGPWGLDRELLTGCRARHHSTVAAAVAADGTIPDLLAHPAHLPIASGSIDAVLLPHCLEIEPDPQAVLREADRVLYAEGCLLVLGFHPWSPWGLRAAASRQGFPPGFARLLSERRLRDWLVLLGYEVAGPRHYLYNLPRDRAEGEPMRGALKRGLFNPLPPGGYLLKARKRVYGLTPLKQRRRERAPLVGALVKPTSTKTRQ
jgi:SAM-dependent methyltransferase